MPMYICSVCGEHGNSKCFRSRNMFADDQMAALMRAIMCVHQPTGYPEGKHEIKIDFYKEDSETLADAVIKQLSFLVRNKESFTKALCNHVWVMQADECELGCCKKSEIKNQRFLSAG